MSNGVKSEEIKTWWQGNSTRMWRVLIIAYISTLSFFGGWIFNRTSEFPDKYIGKADFFRVVQRIEGKLDKLNDNLVDIIRDRQRVPKG